MNEQPGTAIGSGDGRLFVAPAPGELNKALPNFEVECLIGQGGMGAVYKARQPKLDRFVAIKVLPASLGLSEHNFAERFQREARTMAGLNHPHIVTLHDFGETETGYLYIVMEYVDGKDMHDAIVSGRTGVNQALAWMIQLCDAVQYAHEHGVVHRDIKPANILINKEGQVKVGDFGLVKLIGRKLETAITLSKVAMGTPDYSAPESLEEGGVVDHRADLYSMGVLLYELLTGKVPRGAWKPPSAFVSINTRLDQIVVKAMQPDPTQRYQTAHQLKEAIQNVRAMGATGEVKVVRPKAGELTPTARGAVKAHQLTQRKRKRDGPLGQIMLVLFIFAFSAGGILLLTNREKALHFWNEFKMGQGSSSGSATPPEVAPTPAVPAPTPGVAEPPKNSAEPGDGLRLIRAEEGWIDVVSSLTFPRDLVSGKWKLNRKSLTPLSQKDSDRSRLRVPMLLEPSFEVGLEVIYLKGIVPFAMTLPTRAGPVPVLIGEAGLPDEPPILAIGSGGAVRHGRSETTSRFPVKLRSSGAHTFSVRVLNRGDEVGIVVTVDGAEAGRLVGTLSDFAPGGKIPEVLAKQVVFGASGALEVKSFRVRSLSAQEWVVEPAKPAPAKKVAPKASAAAAVAAAAAKDAAVKKAAAGEKEKGFVEAVKQRIAEIDAEFEKRETDFAQNTYNGEMASLREKYNAALNRAIQENNSIPVMAAVQREQMRIREGQKVEPTDPPEMPDIVKKARGIYRLEVSKLDEQLNLALAPMLREHLESLSALESEKIAAEQFPEPAKAVLADARKEVEQRLEKVLSFLDELEKSRKADGTATGSPVAPGKSVTP